MNPKRSIIPIVEINAAHDVVGLAGTGFFVGPLPTFITAGHVFRDDLSPGHAYAVAYIGEGGAPAIAKVVDIVKSKYHDIAAIPKAELHGIEPLELTPQMAALNVDVFAYEYSTTQLVKDDAGKRHVYFNALSHKGNLMRASEPDDYGSPTSPTWETSFPALQGASGAPVVAHDAGVVGMLVANFERHLHPAQIAKIESNDGTVEETRYFLPHGIAIRSAAIVAFMTGELGIEPMIRHVAGWQKDPFPLKA